MISPTSRARSAPSAGPSEGVGPNARTHGGFRADIEGLRGIAVLLVVWYHTHLAGLPGGFIGVDVFFVISGFLITQLLVAEVRRSGTIDLPAFYARRARRLLPGAVLMIAATLVAGALLLAPWEQAHDSTSAGAASLYLSNWRFILGVGDYFSPALETDPFLHTWSLAVEEQFYLFWPLLVLLAMRGRAPVRRLAAVLVSSSVVSLAGCIWLTWHAPAWAFFGAPARAWEFGVGAAGALLPATGRFSRARLLLGWVGLVVLVGAAILIGPDVAFPGLVALAPASGTAIVLVAGTGFAGRGVGRLLAVRPLQRIGELSYSWYLWHWPFLVLSQALAPTMTVAGRVLCSLAALGVAAVTHRLVENPVRFHPRLVARPAWALLLGIGLTLSGAGLAAVGRTLARREGSQPAYLALSSAAATRATLGACKVLTTGNRLMPCGDVHPEARPTVVLFGDSHAAQWLPAIRPLAWRNGWRLVIMTKPACPSVYARVKKSWTWDADFALHCREWRRRALERIALIRPQLVVVANSREHVVGPRRNDERPRSTPGEWRSGSRRLLEELNGTAASVLLIRDTPRLGVDVPVCLARALHQEPWHRIECDSDRTAALDDAVFRAEHAAAAGLAHVRVVDPSEAFCDTDHCYAVRDGLVAFRDMDHISVAFAARLVPLIRGWLAGWPAASALVRVPAVQVSNVRTDAGRAGGQS